MSVRPLSRLPNEQLTRALDDVVASDRTSDAAVLAHVAEFDRRRLYLKLGYTSMYRYCVEHLRMSEDVALKRVRVARVARHVPSVLGAIESGRLNLSGVALLAKHVIRDKAVDLLAAAEGRTRREIETLIAERFPRADVPLAAEVSPLAPAAPPSTAGDAPACAALPPAIVTAPSREQAPGPVPPDSEVGPVTAPTVECGSSPRRARLVAVAPGRFELVALIGQEAYDQLVASVDLLGHAVPSGDLTEVIERAIALQFAQLRKRRCGAADRPRKATPRASSNPRHVPMSVVRAVWERDGGRCAFVGTGGHRCEARDRLELDHVVPVARGGKSTLENLRLLCSAHNQYVAEQAFGAATLQGRREAAKRRRVDERLRKQAERERAEARRHEIARQHEELGEALRTLGYRGEDLRRALACCAERAGAPPEERLKHALGCMAPRARREAASGAEAVA